MTAALKAAKAAGCEIARVEVGKDGLIVVVFTKGKDHLDDRPNGCPNEWDAILK